MNARSLLACPTALALAFLAISLTGCGGQKTARLSGKVTYKDKALPGGTVTFFTEDSKRFEGTIDPEGNYKADGVPFGNLKVAVQSVPPPPTALMPKGAMPKGKGPESMPNYGAQQSAGTHVNLPNDVQDPSKSNITVTVDSADKKFDITLK